ncbi:MAG: hypothetical protein M0R76_11800 [Proteobacteria bacterium]|nr:hypothetical protein [Pseudomonadota bacterium]
MCFNDLFKNLITIGGHSRIQKATNDYELKLNEFVKLKDEHESRRGEVGLILLELMNAKKYAVWEVSKIMKVSKNLNTRELMQTNHTLGMPNYSFDQIASNVKKAESELSARKGAIVGVAAGTGTAWGTWALVGTYGVASTELRLPLYQGRHLRARFWLGLVVGALLQVVGEWWRERLFWAGWQSCRLWV